jgi:flagellar export protein FliJ
MKFKFAYENLMKNKKIDRDIAFRNFSEARGELESSESQLRHMHGQIDDSRTLAEDLAKKTRLTPADLEILKWSQKFKDGQDIRIDRQKAVIQNKQIVAEEKHVELTTAAKDFKIFEKLKSRMHEKFKKIQRKQDLKAVDEIVVMRSARLNDRIKP